MLPSAAELQGAFNQSIGEIRGFEASKTSGPLQRSVDEVIRPAIRSSFASQAEAGVVNWTPLAEQTPFMPYRQMHNAAGNPILDVTGKLKRVAQQKNIWQFDGTRGVAFVPSVPVHYAEVHQHGANNYGLKGGLRPIPARPFISVTDTHIAEMEIIFGEWMMDKLSLRTARGTVGSRVGLD